MIRTYSELISFSTYDERLKYLTLLDGVVGLDTFGFDRIFNQKFYHSKEWKQIRDYVILRDNGCDLGIDGLDIIDHVTIHHMNPITMKDIRDGTEFLLNPDYLITVSHDTHNLIHYGYTASKKESDMFAERTRNDTCPWKK